MKKLIYILIAIAVGVLVTYRVVQISNESAREIFNIARVESARGAPVATMIAEVKTDVLCEPVHVKNGKAFISGARIHKFKLGQKLLGGGHIISVSRNIDLDTGLFVIKTSSPDGNRFVQIEYTGVFVPLTAVTNSNTVMISENGVAVAKPVDIVALDADFAVLKGLQDGDIVILTKVEQGTKVKLQNDEMTK